MPDCQFVTETASVLAFCQLLHTSQKGEKQGSKRGICQRRTGRFPTPHAKFANAARCDWIFPMRRLWTSPAEKCAKTREKCRFCHVEMAFWKLKIEDWKMRGCGNCLKESMFRNPFVLSASFWKKVQKCQRDDFKRFSRIAPKSQSKQNAVFAYNLSNAVYLLPEGLSKSRDVRNMALYHIFLVNLPYN